MEYKGHEIVTHHSGGSACAGGWVASFTIHKQGAVVRYGELRDRIFDDPGKARDAAYGAARQWIDESGG